jgi:hypothetical protein
MNPWGFVFLGAGVLLIIAGAKGSYPAIEKALTGHAPPPTAGESGSAAGQGGLGPAIPPSNIRQRVL